MVEYGYWMFEVETLLPVPEEVVYVVGPEFTVIVNGPTALLEIATPLNLSNAASSKYPATSATEESVLQVNAGLKGVTV